MEKIYRVQMNSSGMPNFSTAVEIDTDISDYSNKLWRNAYERGKADRPQGEWIWSPRDTDGTVSGCCSNCSFSHLFIGGHTAQYNFCPHCGARMKGVDDE